MEALLAVPKCRSWEEEFYWKHLKTLNFFCILPDDFHHGLVLPQKFAGNMFLELPDEVPLFGPSGAKWDVTLAKSNNVAIVGDGWKGFVQAHALEATYVLVFKYTGNVGFEVLIFDPKSSCEKESGYFVKNSDNPTNRKNQDDQQKKRSSDEAFGTATIVLEDDESEFGTSDRVREDTTWTGGTNSKQAPQQWSSGSRKQGGHRRQGSRGRRRKKSASLVKAGSVGKEKPVVENRESNRQLGRSYEPSEIRGAEAHIRAESGEGILEVVQYPKPNETTGLLVGMLRNQIGEEPVVENRDSGLELGCSHKSGEIRGKKTIGNEHFKKLNSPENGESIRDIVNRLRFYETRGKPLLVLGKKAKEYEAVKEHGMVHSPSSIEVIGKARGRSRKQSTPKRHNLVYENGDKSNTNEAAKEHNGIDTRVSTTENEMVCSNKTVKTRQRRKI